MGHLLKIIKGALVGMGSILPGISGSVIAATINIYQELVNALNSVTKKPIQSVFSIWQYLVGIAIGLGLGFIIIWKLFDLAPIPITLLFIGFIIGAIPSLAKEVDFKKTKWHHVLVAVITVAIMIGLLFINDMTVASDPLQTPYWIYVIIGGLIALSMVVPGLSGAALLMALGYFQTLLLLGGNIINHLINFEISDLLAYAPGIIAIGIGGLIGLILLGKLMYQILKRYKIHFYFGVLGLVLIVPINIVYELEKDYEGSLLHAPWYQWAIGIVLLAIGFISIQTMTKKEEEVKTND